MTDFDPFNEKGKCSDCNENKPLDEMIEKDKDTGIYHCNDCHTDIEWDFYKNYFTFDTINAENKMHRLMKWCFG